MNDLSVEVRHQEITVTKPGTGLRVTYRRVANEPVLEALCSMRGDPDANALNFLTEAWKAAHALRRSVSGSHEGIAFRIDSWTCTTSLPHETPSSLIKKLDWPPRGREGRCRLPA